MKTKQKAELREGVLRSEDWVRGSYPMMLLTFAGRPTYEGEHGRFPIEWKKYVKPEDLEVGIHVPDDWKRMSEKEFCDWPIRQGFNTRQTVIWRGLLTPKQWRRYITGCRAHMGNLWNCLLYTSPSPRDRQKSRMPSSA